jgi:hypothetical protein
MRKLIILVMLFILAVPVYGQVDGVMGVETSKDGTVIHYAKWKLVAQAHATYSVFEQYWQNYEDDGTATFLFANDAELAAAKAALGLYNIPYGRELNVELTEEQKGWLDSSSVTSRSQVDGALRRAKAINDAATLEDLKRELIRDSSQTRTRLIE